jgi:hypothetical protein
VWEFRLIWVAAKPEWWDDAWQRGSELLAKHGGRVESRSDRYLVLPDCADVGLKFRGVASTNVEVKILRHRLDGWELWDRGTLSDCDIDLSQRDDVRQVRVEKTRIVTSGHPLAERATRSVDNLPVLGELVAIGLPGRSEPLHSLCVEAFQPLHSVRMQIDYEHALCCGYPELLTKFVAAALP